MPVTVRGTDILFNDGTTQSTAAGAPSTTQVLNATAAASVGAVGTYAELVDLAFTSRSPGETVAGSGLRYTGGGIEGSTPSGTWRLMGQTFYGTYIFQQNFRTSVWLRIS